MSARQWVAWLGGALLAGLASAAAAVAVDHERAYRRARREQGC